MKDKTEDTVQISTLIEIGGWHGKGRERGGLGVGVWLCLGSGNLCRSNNAMFTVANISF